MLCLHLSCLLLFSASLPVYLLCVVTDRHGNTCLFTGCVCLYILYLSSVLSLCKCTRVSYVHESVHDLLYTVLYLHAHACYTCTCAPLCMWPLETLWPRQWGVACWHTAIAGELPSPRLIESKQANQSQCFGPLSTLQPFSQSDSREDDGCQAAKKLQLQWEKCVCVCKKERSVSVCVCVGKSRWTRGEGKHADVSPTTSWTHW